MKYYKNRNNDIFAYESDGSQDHVIPDDQLAITDVEANVLRLPPIDIVYIRSGMSAPSWAIRRALNQQGLRAKVETAISTADQDSKDMWEYAVDFKRLHPLVISMGEALGKTELEVDALFELANTFNF